jgi:hypothetical protein
MGNHAPIARMCGVVLGIVIYSQIVAELLYDGGPALEYAVGLCFSAAAGSMIGVATYCGLRVNDIWDMLDELG